MSILIIKDKKQWDELLNQIKFDGVLYSMEYYQLMADLMNEELELTYYQDGDSFILYPYIKKKVNKLGFAKELPEIYYDIANLEYGGPISNNPSKELFDKFLKEFNRYCIKNNIITEWCRLYPFLNNHESIIDSEKISHIYYIDLKKDSNKIWQEFKKSNKNSINKAKRENIVIENTTKQEDINAFYELYKKTMIKRGAREFYFYSREYFTDIFDVLKEKVNLFVAKYKGKVIAGSFFLNHKHIAHYYLSTTDPNYPNLGSANLLLYKAISYFKNKECKIFNLGGGYSKDDMLSKFKSTFSKTTLDFYRYKKIHNPKIYKLLTNYKKEYNKKQNIKTDLNFFPFYRGETN